MSSQPRDERSVGELLQALTDQTGTLIRQEIALARAELSAEGRQLGAAVRPLAVGAGLALLAAGAAVAFLIAVLDTAMATWLAALIVTVVLGGIAAVALSSGKRRLQRALPPTPDKTIESVKEDVQWAKTQTRSAAR